MNQKPKKKVIIRMLQEYLMTVKVVKMRKTNPKKKRKIKMLKKVRIFCFKKKT